MKTMEEFEAEYRSLKNKKKDPNDIIAYYFDDTDKSVKLVIFTMGKGSSIKKFLPNSTGQASSFNNIKQNMWIIGDMNSRKKLIFRVCEGFSKYGDGLPEDVDVVKYICELN